METVLPLTQEAFKPRYRLGRITSKYLIIDIFAFSYITREEAIYRLFKSDKSSRILVTELYKQLPKLIPHQLQSLKLEFPGSGKYNCSGIVQPTTFILNNTNHLNNHLKLDMIINAEMIQLFPKTAIDILAHRHLKINDERYAFIRDKLTINFQARDISTFYITEIDDQFFQKLKAMQLSQRIQIICKIYDFKLFAKSSQRQLIMQNLEAKLIDVTIYLGSDQNLQFFYGPFKVKTLTIIASSIFKKGIKSLQFLDVIDEIKNIIEQFPITEALSFRQEVSIQHQDDGMQANQIQDKFEEFTESISMDESCSRKMAVRNYEKYQNGQLLNSLIISEAIFSDRQQIKSGKKKIIQPKIKPFIIEIDLQLDFYDQLQHGFNAYSENNEQITIKFVQYIFRQSEKKVLASEQIESINHKMKNSHFKNLAIQNEISLLFEKQTISYIIEIVNNLGPTLTTLELPISLRERKQIEFLPELSILKSANKLPDLLEECKQLSLLNKIKFYSKFNIEDVEEFHKTFIKPYLFPNLKCLEFTNVTFTFKDKNELIYFFQSEQYKNPLLLLPNISSIEMNEDADYKTVEEFCKHQLQPCTIEMTLVDESEFIVEKIRKLPIKYPLIQFKFIDPSQDALYALLDCSKY